MNWPRHFLILTICVGATGCATTTNRDGLGPQGIRGVARSRPATPRQVSLPPEQADVFAATAPNRLDKYRLSRYFPGLGHPTPAATPAAGVPAHATLVAASVPAATTNPGTSRPSWFAFRKPREAQTYLTDARPVATATGPLVGVKPSVLPIALQLPTGAIADRAVMPTSVDLPTPDSSAPKPADGPAAEPAAVTPETAVPSNPDSSSADASPLSKTEPQLAVKPIDPPAAEPAAQPADDASAIPKTTSPPVAVADAPAEPGPAAVDPRERPRMTRTPTVPADPAAAETDGPQAKPAAEPTRVAAASPRSAADAQTVRAMPSVADPGNSLGLPQPMLPASYTRHDSVAVRGTGQSQPGPVLASPQVAPSSQAKPSAQSAATPTGATKTWRRPCFRRLVRRMCKLGEFANPPTAAPH